MRDVIVIGAGGGGPVVAKELAARGLDVLLLEAGPRHADPEREWTPLRERGQQRFTGYFRWGPADRAKPAWLREVPHNGLHLSALRRRRHHAALLRQFARAMPGVFAGYAGADAGAYDVAHRFPFTYDELVPYYEWVEHTLPVQTAAMGTKEAFFFRGCGTARPAGQHDEEHHPRLVPPPGERHPPARRQRRPHHRRQPAHLAPGHRLHALRLLHAGLLRASPSARGTSRRSARPTTATCRWRSPPARWQPGGRDVTLVTDAFATKIGTGHRRRRNGRPLRHLARRRHRRERSPRRPRSSSWPPAPPRRPGCGSTRGCPTPTTGSAAATPTITSTGCHRRVRRRHRLVQGRRLVGPRRLPGPRLHR